MQYEHQTGLDRFLEGLRDKYAQQKRKFLDLKFERNYQAVTNRDFRKKTWKLGEGEDWRSNTWIGIIRKKVLSFLSIFIDTTLSNGRIPFELNISPEDVDLMSKEELDEARNQRDGMATEVQEQLKLRKAIKEYKKFWFSLPMYGMTFSKFTVEDIETSKWQKTSFLENDDLVQYMDNPEQYESWEMVTDSRAVPGHIYRSVWDISWDMEEEDFSKAGVTEKTYHSAYNLRQLKGEIGYFDDIIEDIIEEQSGQEGHSKEDKSVKPGMRDIAERKRKFDGFEFWVRAPRKLINSFKKRVDKKGKIREFESLEHYDFENVEEEGRDDYIFGEWCNGRVIRLIDNNTGGHPYKVCYMEENLDEAHGNGLADNAEDAQGWLIGMIRALEDNKKLSGNVILAVKERLLADPSELDEIKPGMKLHVQDGPHSVRDAVLPVVFPDVGETLLSGINMAERFLDTLTIPTILQGFTLEKHKTDTAFEADQLQKNAGTYIGLVIKNSDQDLIEPHVDEIVDYNMRNPDFRYKGNFTTHATGFVGFQNTIIRGQKIREMLAFALSNEIMPGFIDMQAHFDEAYRSADLDPDKFLATEEEKAERAEQQRAQQEEAEAKAVEAEKIKVGLEAEAKVGIETAKGQIKKEAKEADFQRSILLEVKKADLITKENDREHLRALELQAEKSEDEKELERMKPKPEKKGLFKK